jgi:DNA polymerase-4
MSLLRSVSPLVEPLSLDEAFVDLAAADLPDLEVETVTAAGAELRRRVQEVTGGLTATVGIASSKFLAKVASELDKPDGMTVVAPGAELDLLRPMKVKVIPGVGPATAERLRRAGIHTVADLEAVAEGELVRLLGQAQGHGLWQLARAQDSRPVVSEREAKSISVEGTYDSDLTDRRLMEGLLSRQAREVGTRMQKNGISGRTVTIKVRLYDFTTLSRSATLPSPTDATTTIGRLARTLLAELVASGATAGGVRLLGVGVSGLADWVQEDLFGETSEEEEVEVVLPEPPRRTWPPGADVVHDEMGAGWVWGSGSGVVTVRFETADTPPGPVRSFRADDPALHRWEPPAEE